MKLDRSQWDILMVGTLGFLAITFAFIAHSKPSPQKKEPEWEVVDCLNCQGYGFIDMVFTDHSIKRVTCPICGGTKKLRKER